MDYNGDLLKGLFMFERDKSETPIEAEINRTLVEMDSWPQDTEEYAKRLNYLERLHKLKETEKPERVSRDTMVVVGGNILAIVIMVAYEQKHILASKGLSLLMKANIKS